MGIFVVATISNEIPVAPPSIKLLGSKKPSSPKAAEKTPAVINKKFRIFLSIDTLNLLKAFAFSSLEIS